MSLDGYVKVSTGTKKKTKSQPKKISEQPLKTVLQSIETRVSATIKPLVEFANLLEKNKNEQAGKLISLVMANSKANPKAKPDAIAEYSVWSFFEEHHKKIEDESDREFYRREKMEREAVATFLNDYFFEADCTGPIAGWIKRNNLLNLEILEEIGGALTEDGKQSDSSGKQEEEWESLLHKQIGKSALSCIRATDEMKKVIGQFFTAAVECDDEKYIERYSKKLYKLLSVEEMFESAKEKEKRLAREAEDAKKPTKRKRGNESASEEEDDEDDDEEEEDDDDEDDEEDDEDDDDDEDSESEEASAPVSKNPFKKPRKEEPVEETTIEPVVVAVEEPVKAVENSVEAKEESMKVDDPIANPVESVAEKIEEEVKIDAVAEPEVAKEESKPEIVETQEDTQEK